MSPLYSQKRLMRPIPSPPTTPSTQKKIKFSNMLTSFEVEQKPPVAEVEVRVVAVLMHVLENLRVQYLE